LHGIEPKDTLTIKLQVSHYFDWTLAASALLKGRAWFGWYSKTNGRLVRGY
jgi:hypothetical protein